MNKCPLCDLAVKKCTNPSFVVHHGLNLNLKKCSTSKTFVSEFDDVVIEAIKYNNHFYILEYRNNICTISKSFLVLNTLIQAPVKKLTTFKFKKIQHYLPSKLETIVNFS